MYVNRPSILPEFVVFRCVRLEAEVSDVDHGENSPKKEG